MLLTELQYLGTVDYYALMLKHGDVIFEEHENYTKRTYRNRCHILGANGVLKLSIPLEKGKNQQQSIRDTRIAYQNHWNRQHWRSIKSAYGNAPFFEFYADELKAIFESQTPTLFDFNLKLTELIIELLQLEINYSFSETYQKTPSEDLFDARNIFLPTKSHPIDLVESVTYPQVFEEKFDFEPHLSILDLMFCQGNSSYQILEEMVEI